MVWLLFALLANLLFSIVNLFDQLVRKRHIKHDVSIVVVWIALYFIIWLAIAPFIKLTVPEAPKLAAALVAGVISVLTALPYYYSLSVEEVSRVMPVWQFSSLFVLLMSAFFLGESLTARHYLGFAVMFLGGLLLAVKNAVKGFELNRAVLLTFAFSVLWAVHLVLAKFVYSTESYWNGFFWIYLGSFAGAGLLLLLPNSLKHLRAQVAALSKGGAALMVCAVALAFLADMAFLFAIKTGPVSLVSVIGSTQAVFVFVMAVFISKYFPSVIKEPIDRKTLLTKAVAISLVIAGLYLMR